MLFFLNCLVMIIPFNYLAVINSIGELMWNSYCATPVISMAVAVDFLSTFLLTNQNLFASSKSCSMLIVPYFSYILYSSLTKKSEETEICTEWHSYYLAPLGL